MAAAASPFPTFPGAINLSVHEGVGVFYFFFPMTGSDGNGASSPKKGSGDLSGQMLMRLNGSAAQRGEEWPFWTPLV